MQILTGSKYAPIFVEIADFDENKEEIKDV